MHFLRQEVINEEVEREKVRLGFQNNEPLQVEKSLALRFPYYDLCIVRRESVYQLLQSIPILVLNYLILILYATPNFNNNKSMPYSLNNNKGYPVVKESTICYRTHDKFFHEQTSTY